MADTKISALTAVATPASTDEYATNQGGTSKRTTLAQVSTYANTDPAYDAFVVLDAAYTLTSSTAVQKLFNATANGAVTLETGWYFMDAVIGVTSMSATSGNARFTIGVGTAVLGGSQFHVVGVDGASATAATQTGSWTQTAATAASAVTAGAGTAMMMNIRGAFEVTTAGTVIPQITLVTAAAAVVGVGSYWRCRRVGDAGGNVTQGSWS